MTPMESVFYILFGITVLLGSVVHTLLTSPPQERILPPLQAVCLVVLLMAAWAVYGCAYVTGLK